MPFAARVLREEAVRYRELSRFINDARTLALLDEMAGDLESKATAIEAKAANPVDDGLT